MYCPRPNLRNYLSCCSLKNFYFTSSTLKKNHYDSLGITPAATQAEVKTAYYKLSKIHHPDRNDGSEASSQKFREVSAAYEVLGNVKLRKMYDKGLINDSGQQSRTEHSHARFYRSREVRTRPPPPDGKTPIYDFDEWSRQHYGATFARDMRIKRRKDMKQMSQQHTQWNKQREKFLVAFFTLTLIFFYVIRKTNDYDVVKTDNGTTKR